MDENTIKEINRLFHKLWTKAATKNLDYQKEEWRTFRDLLAKKEIYV